MRSLIGGSLPRTKSLFEKGTSCAQEAGLIYIEGLILKNQAKFLTIEAEEKKKLLRSSIAKFEEVGAIEEAKTIVLS